MEDVIRVEKLENGFEIQCLDEEIAAENMKPRASWREPYKSYAFAAVEDAIEFITKKMKGMKTRSKDAEYDAAFKEAAAKS